MNPSRALNRLLMRRRSVVFAPGVFSLAAMLGACQSSESEKRPKPQATGSREPARQQSRPAIVFLGDSLTAGRGLAEQEALPALIQQKLDQQGLAFTVINGGRSGDTTAGGLSRLAWYLRDSVRARALVIGLGSNDAMRGQPLSSIEENLRKIIRQARTARPELLILLWELKTFPNMGAQYGDAYESLFRRIAAEERVPLIPFPLAGVAADPSLNQSDGIHPTAAGTKVVAENVWRALHPKLQALSPKP